MIRSSIVCLLAVSMCAGGCSKPAPSDPTKPLAEPKSGIAVVAAKDGKPAIETKLPLDFIRALNDNKASASQFSEAFKKSLTQTGFTADDSAQTYLDGVMKSRKFTTTEEKTTDAATVVRGTVSGGETPEFFTVLIRNGTIDWMHRSRLTATSVPADGNWAVLASVVGFWDSLGADRSAQAGLVLTTAQKAILGPPFPSDKDGYNKGAMLARLRGYSESLTGYTVATQATAGETATATGVLTKAGGTQTFSMKLVREAGSGVWKIDGLEVK